MILNNRLITIKRLLRNVRQFHCSLKNTKYEGTGRTTATILNLEFGETIFIDQCTPMGFQLVDGSTILGPAVLFPKLFLCWNVKSGRDINEKTLSLFTVLEPKPDIVVLGLETSYNYQLIKEMKRPLLEKDIPVEVQPIERACGVYNFLLEDGRYAAAALIPPLQNETLGYKMLQSKMARIRNEKMIKA